MSAKRSPNFVGVSRLLRDGMARKGMTRKQFAVKVGMKETLLHSIMLGHRSLPAQDYSTVARVLEITREDIERAQKESDDYLRQGGRLAIDSILVEAKIAQGSISLEQLKLATELAEKFENKLSFRLFLDLLREKTG
jgi:transcriptional regulator with XRE-family HTH domain